ncbi:phage tail spike protein [Marinilactibacillus psychrotolerans]|uniref:phage tail spike protein n=1 Tax=Marinilactibacillus psychrotolerans TaxID=191770 RepID=UPI003887084A
MITLHDAKETNFEKNGYGVLDDLVFNDGGSWEMNSEFKITFEVPALTEFTKYVEARNIVQAPVPFMNRQLFRIYRTEKTLSSIYVEARHIFYDLLDNWIEDTNIVRQVGNSAIQQLLSRTQYPNGFTATSDITTTGSARIVRMNPVEALLDDQKENSFVNRWGGELVRNNFQIELLERMGADRGVKIEHQKDLLGYEATIDISTIVTRIHPVGFDGLELPEKYVDSPLMDPDHPIIAEVKYEDIKAAVGDSADDEEAVPLEQAYELLRQAASNEFEVNHVDEPETVVNVDFVALHNTEQYKDFADLQEVRAGDTVKVLAYDHGFEITSRLVGFEFSLLKKDHYTSTTLGNHVLEYTSSETDVNDLRERVEEAERTAVTATLAANGRNRNFFGAEDPNTLELDARLGDNYFLENGESFIIYLYVEVNEESYWKRASLDEVAFKNEMKENSRTVNEATETAGQALTAGNQAKELANQAKTAAENASEVGGQALTAGQQAQELANEAKADSSSALLKANEAISSTNTLTTRVDTLNSEYDGLQTIVQGKASQTEVTQLSTQINLRVEKDKIINQINVSTEGILIAGSKTHITGLTTIDTGVIETAHIANAAINKAKIADLAVNEAKIASLAITNAKIGTAAINEAKIADLAVTTAKIANAAISSAKIGEAAIKTAHIGDAQITTAKISSLSASKITTGTLNADNVSIINLNASNITSGILKSIDITGSKITNTFDIEVGGDGTTSIRMIGNTIIEGPIRTTANITDGSTLTSYIDPVGIGAIINNSNGSIRSQYHLDSSGLALQNGSVRTYVGDGGFRLSSDDNPVGGTMQYNSADARIRLASWNGVEFGSLDQGYYRRIMSVTGFPAIDMWAKVNMQHNHIENIKHLKLAQKSGYSGSIIFSSNDNHLWMGGRWGTHIGAMGQDGATVYEKIYFNWNGSIMFHENVNMNGYSISNQSDGRFKTNVHDYKKSSLDFIKDLKFVTYEYTHEKMAKGIHFGLIAQDAGVLGEYDESIDKWTINTSKQIMHNSHAIQEFVKINDHQILRIRTKHNVLTNKITHMESYVKNKIETKLEKAEKEIESLKEKVKLLEESA